MSGFKAVQVQADKNAANVLPIIRSFETRRGETTLREIAGVERSAVLLRHVQAIGTPCP